MKTWIAKLFSQRKPNIHFDFSQVGSIISRPIGHAIGDAIVHIAMMYQLRTLYPHARLGVFISKRNRGIFNCCEVIDELIEDNALNYLRQRKKWDLFIDGANSITTKNILFDSLLAARCKIIFNKVAKAHYNSDTVHNYDFYCPINAQQHITDRLGNSVLAQHFTVPPARLKLTLPNMAAEARAAYWHKKIKILLAPQSSRPAHRIPAKELADLLNQYDEKLRVETQFILANTANSEAYFTELRQSLQADIQIALSPPLSLDDYLALVADCSVAICIDSATVHIACAFSRPLLSFYANDASAVLWAPKPHEGVSNLMLKAQTAQDSKETRDFPIGLAANWLNQYANHMEG